MLTTCSVVTVESALGIAAWACLDLPWRAGWALAASADALISLARLQSVRLAILATNVASHLLCLSAMLACAPAYGVAAAADAVLRARDARSSPLDPTSTLPPRIARGGSRPHRCPSFLLARPARPLCGGDDVETTAA